MFAGPQDQIDTSSCLIPRFDGAILSLEWKEAVWARFVTAAPRSSRRGAIGSMLSLSVVQVLTEVVTGAVLVESGFCAVTPDNSSI